MFTKIFNYIFSKTPLGKLVDGNKTIIGFAVLVLRYLIAILSVAASLFPQFPVLVVIHTSLAAFDAAMGPYLEDFGISVMAIGVAHKAVKEKEDSE